MEKVGTKIFKLRRRKIERKIILNTGSFSKIPFRAPFVNLRVERQFSEFLASYSHSSRVLQYRFPDICLPFFWKRKIERRSNLLYHAAELLVPRIILDKIQISVSSRSFTHLDISSVFDLFFWFKHQSDKSFGGRGIQPVQQRYLCRRVKWE